MPPPSDGNDNSTGEATATKNAHEAYILELLLEGRLELVADDLETERDSEKCHRLTSVYIDQSWSAVCPASLI